MVSMSPHVSFRETSGLHALAAAPSTHAAVARQQTQHFITRVVVIGQGFQAVKQSAAFRQNRFVIAEEGLNRLPDPLVARQPETTAHRTPAVLNHESARNR